MKILCGTTAYVDGEAIGTLCGLRINAVHDRVNGVIVRSGGTAGRCYYLAFEQIAGADEDGIQAFPPFDGREGFETVPCTAETQVMEQWLKSLVPDDPARDGTDGTGFLLMDETSREAAQEALFTVPGDAGLDLNVCGCGHLEAVEVDAQGYIDHVSVQVDVATAATVQLKPLPKRHRNELIDRAHAAMHLA